MLCPECNKPMQKTCDICGVFFETQELEVYDLYNYTIKQSIRYQKITHFREVLNNFQGRECKYIPSRVIDIVKRELKDNIAYLNHIVLRTILKKHKLTKYVENVNSILFILTGAQPPCIPKLIEVKLIKYFKQVAEVFHECKTPSRINFLNYYYVLFKLLELMEQIDLSQVVPRIKSKHRVLEHDKIWLQICNALNWKFLKTKVGIRYTTPSQQTRN